MLWIALTCPDLPLQVFTRGSSDDAPLAVVEYAPPARILAASAAAQALGVQPGERLSAARALAPALLLRERDAVLEAATLTELAAWAGRFTPLVSLPSADTLLLEVSASLRLFGGLEAFLHAVRRGLADLGLSAQLAVSPTPLAAHWLALARPDSVLTTEAGWQAALDALPLAVVCAGSAVSAATLELLAGIGLRTLGQARSLPRAGLARRQAGAFMQALALARGELPDLRPRHVPPAQHTACIALPVPAVTVEPLLFVASRLITGLAAWLASLQAACDRFELLLEHEGAATTRVEIISGEPSRDAARLMLLVREHLAVLVLTEPVESVRLMADAPVSRPGHTPDLFGNAGQVRENLTLLLDRLRARLGEDALFRPVLHADHRPERACRTQPVSARVAMPARVAAQRPCWLLEQPKPLLSLHGLQRVAGPERIESGWWDGHDTCREYFVVRTREDALWWVFRDLGEGGGWYLHGYFG
jgi:protein ImuB